MTYAIESNSLEDTIAAGVAVGRNLRGGEVIELIADLGGGKTTFVRGLAKGAGSLDAVASPSFAISRIYKAGKLRICHYDFYRLSQPGVVLHEIKEDIADKSACVVVERPKVVASLLPSQRLRVELTVTGDNRRKIKFVYPQRLKYLLAGV